MSINQYKLGIASLQATKTWYIAYLLRGASSTVSAEKHSLQRRVQGQEIHSRKAISNDWGHDGESPVLHGGSACKGDKQVTMDPRMFTTSKGNLLLLQWPLRLLRGSCQRTFQLINYSCTAFAEVCGAWRRIGRVDAFRPRIVGSNPALGTLGKSFTYSCF